MARKKVPQGDPLIRKGFEIRCEKNHLIGTFTCDKYYRDPMLNTDVEWTNGNRTMVGDVPQTCADCGADWFRKLQDRMREIMIARGHV